MFKHISQMIDDANQAVSHIQVTHSKVVMEIMLRPEFTPEQKAAIVSLMTPIADATAAAQQAFNYNVDK